MGRTWMAHPRHVAAVTRLVAGRVVSPPRLVSRSRVATPRWRWLSQAVNHAVADDPENIVVPAAAAAKVEMPTQAHGESTTPTGSGQMNTPVPPFGPGPASPSSMEDDGSRPDMAKAPASQKHPASPFRVRMVRAIKDRDYEQVLNLFDGMLEAGVAPDVLALNCVVEAKASAQGAAAAREMLAVRATAWRSGAGLAHRERV